LEIIKTPIEDLFLLKPQLFSDERGDFFETFNKSTLHRAHIDSDFVQDNQSRSAKNVLRGLHFQKSPHEQGKLVRVVSGEALDVAVDIRKYSKTYLKHFSIELNGENNLMLWIPPGFAHGFLSLQDNTIVSYKCSWFYHRESESGIRWNDERLGIEWGISNPILSEKDSVLPFIKDFEKELRV